MLPGSSWGGFCFPIDVLDTDWLYAGGEVVFIGHSPPLLSGLANSCMPGVDWSRGLNGRSSMFWVRLGTGCFRGRRRRIRKIAKTRNARAAMQIPTARPAFAPVDRLLGLGAVSSYLRLKTCSVITVRPEMVGVIAGTNVSDGMV